VPGKLLARPERRASILKAAATAFVGGGFSDTSMDEVAAQAGVTRLIIYRHFASKDELYSAVLEGVAGRLAEETMTGAEGRLGLAAVQALLIVAREDPDGFVLLWRHAAREPAFAAHAAAFRERANTFARALLTTVGVSGRLRERWAAETLVSYVVEAVLHWMEEGSPGRDEEFLSLMAESLPAIVTAWARVPRP
jgi:AcrR family transcriptional regulator